MADTKPVCHVCGSSPCYLICPMVCPFGGDQRLENEDYEANAHYDSVREAFGSTAMGMDDDGELVPLRREQIASHRTSPLSAPIQGPGGNEWW